jgi:Fe-S cluster biosynthesis and repair protein YggX
MSSPIVCVRCGRSAHPLSEPPTGGPLGRQIQESVCADCWNEWREVSGRVIAHYGLNMGNPDHRRQLRELMKDFLNLPSQEGAQAGQ